MSRIVMWFMSTVTVVVLLFGYHTSTSAVPSSGAGLPSSAAGGATAPGGSTGGGGTTSTATTVTGPAVDTRWGPVQVQISVDGGAITGVTVVDYPHGNGKDRQINARAVPLLVQETIDAQSADVDMISGATVTSEGYVDSLQGALDEAGL
jgi:hypothetical protein